METLGLYLFKSVIWLSGFALIYIVFLKNERFFTLNRFYLLSGVIASFIMPLLTIRYTVMLTVPNVTPTEGEVVSGIENMNGSFIFDAGSLLILLYLSGIFAIGFMMIRQSRPVIRSVVRSGIVTSGPVKLIRTSDYTSSFSFFSWIFVNPSVTDIEMKEIVNHEMVHIRQKHWVDLALGGLLCMLQWFNPLVWIYLRMIRQNHEYIADEGALQRSSDPAVYRATLLNQIAGSQVVILANSFNYSLNKKRFEMMKNIITSPYRKMKIFLILPVFAIVLYAFAKPEYRYDTTGLNGNDQLSSVQDRTVKGSVVQAENSKPLEGAVIVAMGTTSGTVTEADGTFKLEKIPEGGSLAVSYVGYKSVVIKPVFTSDMKISLDLDTINSEKFNDPMAPPPPPPPPPSNGVKIRGDGPPPLIVVDGIITETDLNKMPPETIASVNVLKDTPAIDKYGEKGKNGVIEITTKKSLSTGTNIDKSASDNKVLAGNEKRKEGFFMVVEELPQFPGGKEAMSSWIYDNMKYPGDAVKKKIEGKVYVTFLITSAGKIKNVNVQQPGNPLLDAEAKRIIAAMPEWKPGTQSGKAVDVYYKVPVDFKLAK
jgi:TonB family protein